jgi:1-deoxy-D-xylulose-5-phosphate reductoisomerase
MNAANEVVVSAFLEGKITFLEMPTVIERCMEKMQFVGKPNLDDYIATDKETRLFAKSII